MSRRSGLAGPEVELPSPVAPRQTRARARAVARCAKLFGNDLEAYRRGSPKLAILRSRTVASDKPLQGALRFTAPARTRAWAFGGCRNHRCSAARRDEPDRFGFDDLRLGHLAGAASGVAAFSAMRICTVRLSAPSALSQSLGFTERALLSGLALAFEVRAARWRAARAELLQQGFDLAPTSAVSGLPISTSHIRCRLAEARAEHVAGLFLNDITRVQQLQHGLLWAHRGKSASMGSSVCVINRLTSPKRWMTLRLSVSMCTTTLRGAAAHRRPCDQVDRIEVVIVAMRPVLPVIQCQHEVS